MGALWPDDEQIGKAAFHSALYRLRQVLRRSEGAGKLVQVKGGDYWLDESRVAVDVDRFDRMLAQARVVQPAAMADLLESAVQLYQGDYLSNLRYYDWAAAERQRLREAYVGALKALGDHYLEQLRCAEALDCARQALQCDPYQEESHLLAMRCYGALGDRRGLMRQYETLTAVLRAEFDVPPLPQTEQAYLALMRRVQLAEVEPHT